MATANKVHFGLKNVYYAKITYTSAEAKPEISVSRTKKVGEKHLLLARNPVFLITGGRP